MVLKAVIGLWLTGAVFCTLPVIQLIPGDRYKVNHIVGMTLSTKMDEYFLYEILVIISLLTIWTLNIAAYINYRKGRDEVMSSNAKQRKMQRKSQRNLMTSLRSVIIVFSACYSPLAITQSFSHTKSLHLVKYPDQFVASERFAFNVAMYLSARLVFCNSFMNCIIYSFSSKPFLNALKKHVLPGNKMLVSFTSKSVTSVGLTMMSSAAGQRTNQRQQNHRSSIHLSKDYKHRTSKM